MSRLLDLVFPLRSDEAIVRSLSLDEFLSSLAPELYERTTPATVALLPFADRRVRAVIHEAKYHGNSRAFDLLSSALVDYLAGDDRFDGKRDYVLIPLPLGKARRTERGFNQVEEVAKRAARELKIKIDPRLLSRQRETISQVSLPREERERNMRGAFAAAQTLDRAYSYIVLDDVTTTGATLAAAIVALQEAGAEEILPIALAH